MLRTYCSIVSTLFKWVHLSFKWGRSRAFPRIMIAFSIHIVTGSDARDILEKASLGFQPHELTRLYITL